MNIRTIDLHFLGTPKAIAVYLMETDDGPILFETGPYSCLPKLEQGLAEYGYKTSDIKHVFLTHVHLDHAGAAWHFAEQGANIYVHPKGEKHLLDTSKLVESATKIYGPQMDFLWGKFKPIESSQLIISGHQETYTIYGQKIRSLHSPGHAVHHIAWHTSDGIICGDVAGIRMHNGPAVPPCPPPDINLDHWKNSLDILIEEAPSTIYISHFGAYNDAVEHLEQLRAEIDVWDLYAYQLFQSNQDVKNAIKPFEEWVESRLLKLTNDATMVDKYSIANPSWMCINGLFRYYRKRAELEASANVNRDIIA